MLITSSSRQQDQCSPISIKKLKNARSVCIVSGILVCAPVFVEAPLVRAMPLLSLFSTIFLVLLSYRLLKIERTKVWGDLLLGFSYSWLAGAIYWGWFRDQPFIHIPIESLCLPFVLYALSQGRHQIGGLFYLGSLVGTIITDIYFYLTDLIPYWRQIMSTPDGLIAPIFHQALAKIQNPWGISWAFVLASILLSLGLYALRQEKLYWQSFAGAILSTIFVDSLFWAASYLL